MLKAIYHTFHHRKLPLVFLLYQMPTKVVQQFQNRSSWHEKGSVQYIYLKKEKKGMSGQQGNILSNQAKILNGRSNYDLPHSTWTIVA
jgi:hypothetical protein